MRLDEDEVARRARGENGGGGAAQAPRLALTFPSAGTIVVNDKLRARRGGPGSRAERVAIDPPPTA